MKTLKTVNLKGLGKKHQGKVRDYYILGDKRVLVTTDRISAFDKVLGLIPYKGQALNQLTCFWFEKTKDIVANHLLSQLDPNVVLVKSCQAYPIEIVVRGYITGVTKTSLWFNYAEGQRKIYGLKFSDGLKKNQKLAKPVITPTTRGTAEGGHDEKITKEEIIERGIVSKKIYEEMERVALKLFERGTKIAAKAGLILVDTKYEFGDYNGQLTLIDEVHTPDCSRFWIKKTCKERLKKGLEPDNFDKEFFRLWYNRRDYYGDGPAPKMPESYKLQVSQRYLAIFKKLTGEKLKKTKGDIEARIRQNLGALKDQVVILAGSKSDEQFVKKLVKVLKEIKLEYSLYYASAHKQPKEVLAVLEKYESLGKKVVLITVAGRSNALSGFCAANSSLPVIACPPFKSKHDYLINIHSTLQMPSKVPVMTVIDPANAVLAAKRILRVDND